MRTHTPPLACEPVYDNDGDVEYYRDCGNASCASSSEHSAAQSSQRRT